MQQPSCEYEETDNDEEGLHIKGRKSEALDVWLNKQEKTFILRAVLFAN